MAAFPASCAVRLNGGVRVSVTPPVSTLLQCEHLDPKKIVCFQSLHGRCSSKTCANTHLEEVSGSEAVEKLVEHFLSHRYVPASHVTQDMFQKAISAASTIAKEALRKGANLETCLCCFITSINPMCVPCELSGK